MRTHGLLIESLPQARRIIKEMNLSPEWDSDYRSAARQALVEILEDRMNDRLDRYLDEVGRSLADRRNGSYCRHLLTELGDIELRVPRSRKTSMIGVVRAYARRVGCVERMILACFVLGISTRKIAHALMPVLGEPVSATAVSRVAKMLDAAVSAFHKRPLSRPYRFLMFDGVVLKRRTGAGSAKRVVLVVLGVTAKGRKEIIDFRIAHAESQSAWEVFFTDLYRRGLTGEGLEMIVTDGGQGLLAALPFVYPQVPLQRCWVHKTRNVLNYARKSDQPAMKKDLHAISHAATLREAQAALKAFCRIWRPVYPKAVQSLLCHEEELLSFFRLPEPKLWTTIRTTNLIERRFRELRRRTRPMGVFSDRTSMERILYAVFTHENLKEKTMTPFLVMTHNT
jgi:putative transposase